MAEIEEKIKKSTKNEIIESLGHQMWIHTEYPQSAEYTEVCRILVTTFPTLEDSTGNGIVSYPYMDIMHSNVNAHTR